MVFITFDFGAIDICYVCYGVVGFHVLFDCLQNRAVCFCLVCYG